MKKIFLALAFAVLLSLSYAFAQNTLGCCYNPGAGQLACAAARLVFTNECCPQPEASYAAYYKSSQNPNSPAAYAECSSSFFRPNKACSGISECSIGCCCSALGGAIKPNAQCMSAVDVFYKGEMDCTAKCPTPQCNDGIDNDNNGCIDYAGSDTGCISASDTTESGGTCLPEGVNCNSQSYVPELSGFEILPVKGKKSFTLEWSDECAANSIYYELSRCEGLGCTDFNLISTLTEKSFVDSSGNLEFGKFYTYKVKAFYSLQSATPIKVKAATLGDTECLNRETTNNFCADNSAYYCNSLNKLVFQGTKCQSDKICIVSGNKPSCFNLSSCEAKEFGLSASLQSCEAKGYCFYDRSYTTVDYCFACNPKMACYDYRSKGACEKDHCGIGTCQWKGHSNQLGFGACVSTGSYNCQWCTKKGTDGMENLGAYNKVFDSCTPQKSAQLSVGSYKCIFIDGNSKECGNTVCSDYSTSQCGSQQISHDEFNNILNPSNDECGISVCQNINGACAKNADGDLKADCEIPACEQDYYAPDTTAAAINKKGIVDTLAIQIYDKRTPNGTSLLQTESNYTTFLCLEPCGASGHPYGISTQSKNILVSNLNIYDSRTGIRLGVLNEGQNTLRYYSADPSKNIGKVKRITFEAHDNSAGPKVFSFTVTGGIKINEKIYTRNTRFKLNLQFLEPAIITYARLTGKDSGLIIPIDPGPSAKTAYDLTLSSDIPEGEYEFEINAKNTKNIFMDNAFRAVIVVDNKPPSLSIIPQNGETVNSSPSAIKLEFSEDSKIRSVKINSEEYKDAFNTINNRIFTALLNLTDGSKAISVAGSDFAGNTVEKTSTFIVDANPTQITMRSPRFGVAKSNTFNIVIETDNNAECRYDIDNNLEYDFMDRFTVTTGTRHTISSFQATGWKDNEVHKLFVKCKEDTYGITERSFDLSIDTTPPRIKSSFAFPNPIVETPIETTLTVETDEPSICKYGALSQDFESMENKFDNFDNSTFRIINRQKVSLAAEGNYDYYAACMNKAELVSGTASINFNANLSDSIIITSHTQRYYNTTTIALAIQTNKKSQCKYSETDTTVQSGQVFGLPGHAHTKQLVLPAGGHKFYIICKDQYRSQWSSVFLQDITIDISAPVMLFVNDTSTIELKPQKTCNTDRLRVKFLGEDQESGVKQYSYKILKNSQPVTGLKNSFTGNEWIWVENLELEDNTQYIFNTKARNYAELEGAPKSSDGITVDTNACKPNPRCGDSLINQPGEECDGRVFGSIDSCLNYTNFIGGALKCNGNCRLDTSGCTRIPACGNSELDPGEACDGSIFGAIKSCASFNSSFNGGTLKCSATCQLDTTACTEKPKCGNGAINSGEACDGTNLGPLSGKCINYNPSTYTDGVISCAADCKLDTSQCQGVNGVCGDGVLNIGEACDGGLFGTISSCTDYSAFTGGTLSCASTCQLDTTACTEKPKCGNLAIDLGESCDGSNLGPLTGKCTDYSVDFNNGNIRCTNCRLDTAGCGKSSSCGNSKLDTGEQCDGTLFKISNLSCTSYSETFQNGTLACSSCRISTRNCNSNITDAATITCRDSGTCEAGETCNDNSDCRGRYCAEGKCKAANCIDSIKNQGEPDVDCGGVCSAKCIDGKLCNLDSDCSGNYCNFGTCRQPEACRDGKLSPGESDVDCGGYCPSKCRIGKSCTNDDDCGTELRCESSQCVSFAGASDDKDTDGDGLPDSWELANGLDPNDPNDADLDFDNDGLTNREEYQVLNLYGRSSDPTKIDTDGDGFSDKEELDKNTDPTDPDSFPKSSKLKILLFILGIVVLVSGFGYLGYFAIQKKKEEEYTSFKSAAPRQVPPIARIPHPISSQPRQSLRSVAPIQRPRAKIGIPLKERVIQKDIARKKLFENFGNANKPEAKEQIKAAQKPGGNATEKKTTASKSKPKTQKRKIKAPKPKEDVFVRLKEIAKEKKTKKSRTK